MIRERLAQGNRTLLSPLNAPWCWPTDPSDVQRAVSLGLVAPAAPPPGEALVVTLEPPVIWRVRTESEGARPLTGTATQAATLAPQVAARALPTPRRRAMGEAQRLHLHDLIAAGPLPEVVDGPSLGLAMAIAQASLFLEVPIPTDLLALGVIDAHGGVRPVDGVPEKLAWVRGGAPAIRRLVVARGTPVPPGWAVLEVDTVAEAVAQVFPPAALGLPDDPDERRALARLLRQKAWIGRHGLLDWPTVARMAETLRDVLPEGDSRREAEVAAAIARRHHGRVAPLPWPVPPWPWLGQPATRVRAVAQVVQSWTDGASSPLPGQLAEAERSLRTRDDRSAEDAELLGALGRAWAAVGELEAAQRHLSDAVSLWFALDRDADCSHALCELLRVAALRKDEEALALAIRRAQDGLDTSLFQGLSPHYVQHALLRAAVLIGDGARAPQVPATLRTPEPDLGRSTQRWWARALDLKGQRAQADAARASIPADTVEAQLAHLDAALRDGRDPAAVVAALREGSEGHQFERIWARTPTPAALADEYPY